MKKSVIFIVIVFAFISCKNQSELSNLFDCRTSNLENSKSISDFNKNFKLNIPINWKSELYYNEFQSEIFTADTTKQLSESFILDTSFNNGNLTFDTIFYQKTDSILKSNNLEMVNSGSIQFKNKPAFWYLVKGEKKGFEFHQFNILVKNSNNNYFTANSDIYGNKNINSRICETISLLNTVEFLQ